MYEISEIAARARAIYAHSFVSHMRALTYLSYVRIMYRWPTVSELQFWRGQIRIFDAPEIKPIICVLLHCDTIRQLLFQRVKMVYLPRHNRVFEYTKYTTKWQSYMILSCATKLTPIIYGLLLRDHLTPMIYGHLLRDQINTNHRWSFVARQN